MTGGIIQPFDEFVSVNLHKDRPKKMRRIHNYDLLKDIELCKGLCEELIREDDTYVEEVCETWEARKRRMSRKRTT